jgi:hypothetical protein
MPRDSPQDCYQLVEVDRLDEVGCEARRFGPLAIAILSPAGDGHERDVVKIGPSANSLGRLKAIHDWHAKIEQYGLGTETINFGKRRGPIVNDADFIPQQAQQAAKAVGGVGVVIYDQDAWRGSSAIRRWITVVWFRIVHFRASAAARGIRSVPGRFCAT